MHRVRGDIGDGVELAPVERLFKRSEGPLDLVGFGEGLGDARPRVGTGHQFDTLDVGEMPGMRPRHAARAQNEKSHCPVPLVTLEQVCFRLNRSTCSMSLFCRVSEPENRFHFSWDTH